jgi:hypothetical protein
LLGSLTSIICDLSISKRAIINHFIILIFKRNEIRFFLFARFFKIWEHIFADAILVGIRWDSIASWDALASLRRSFPLSTVATPQAHVLLVVDLEFPLVRYAASVYTDKTFS